MTFYGQYSEKDPGWEFENRPLSLSELAVLTQIPILTFFDFAAAFPSVAHAWMWAVLHILLIPDGLLNAIKTLYKDNRVFCNIGGAAQFMFMILSGVLQGCPFSGTLFVIIMDPIMHLFTKYICRPGFGEVRSCADDVGCALACLWSLKRVFLIFESVRKATGLILKPNKCVIVLLSHVANEGNVEAVRQWLLREIPEWVEFQVTNSAKYLGIFMGPKSSSSQWAGPLAKAYISGQITPLARLKGVLQ